MEQKNSFLAALQIDFPIIMAPMFLVSNLEMLKAGMRAGIMATFPTLNYRKTEDLEKVLQTLNELLTTKVNGNYGVNLIVQKTNPFYASHLDACVRYKVPFIITSLGTPAEVIKKVHAYGGKVFCDVTNLGHAKKCADLGCDGFIAVGQGAGGHAGPNPLQVLIPALKRDFPNKFIVAAGGITGGESLLSVMVLGAAGASVGTRFIASTESTVTKDYKQAIIKAGMDDIVMTTRLSGTPATIIDTPQAKKMGYSQNWMEKFLSNNPRTKKYFKMFVQARGMKLLEKSVLPNNYERLWCAGKASELISNEIPCEEIITNFRQEYKEAVQNLVKRQETNQA